MKKLLLVVAVAFSATAFATDNIPVNQKAINTFQRIFKVSEDVKWNFAEKYSTAYFRDGEVATTATFDKDGDLLKTIRYYSGKMLPVNILNVIDEDYHGKSIWGVTEVSTNSGVLYAVVLKDAKNWYNIHFDQSGNSDLVSKYKNAGN